MVMQIMLLRCASSGPRNGDCPKIGVSGSAVGQAANKTWNPLSYRSHAPRLYCTVFVGDAQKDRETCSSKRKPLQRFSRSSFFPVTAAVLPFLRFRCWKEKKKKACSAAGRVEAVDYRSPVSCLFLGGFPATSCQPGNVRTLHSVRPWSLSWSLCAAFHENPRLFRFGFFFVFCRKPFWRYKRPCVTVVPVRCAIWGTSWVFRRRQGSQKKNVIVVWTSVAV